MQFTENKAYSFRSDNELLALMNKVTNDIGNNFPPETTFKEWITTVLSHVNTVQQDENTDNTVLIQTINTLENTVDEKEKALISKDVEIREITNTANENARIATQLQLEADEMRKRLLESNIVSADNQLFSEENRFLFWCLLQVFKKQYPEFTFEKMIVYVFNGFQKQGFLKLDDNDKAYIETVKHLYNGTID